MSILITGRDLPAMRGTFLAPSSPLPNEWHLLTTLQQITLIITTGPSSAALAFKVWPEAVKNITTIIYAGGTLAPGAKPQYGAHDDSFDPAALESLLNLGCPIVFCTFEAANKYKMTVEQLALAYADRPAEFSVLPCGIHVETTPHIPTFGRLVADNLSDHKFANNNAKILI